MTNKEMLESINEAITKILTTGQAYKLGSKTITRADLNSLRYLKQELEAAADAEDSSPLGRRAAAAFFDRR